MSSLTGSGVVCESTAKQGDGATRATPGTRVHCHYIGTLKSNGQKFDSSRDKRRPFSFVAGAGQVIEGWDIIMLQHLTLGGRATFSIASDKAYGPAGAGGVIPPNADLVFDIELLAVGDKCATGFSLDGDGSGGFCNIL